MESIWSKTAGLENRPKLKEDIACDVAVIGGGMAGILTAYFLQKAGKKVVVLEANRIGSGQTGRTTAKITSQHGLIYEKMIMDFGEDKTEQYLKANQRAIQRYGQVVEENSIDCDFKILPSYLYSLENGEKLKSEAEAVKSLGIPCSFREDTELPFSVKGAVEFPDQAQFNPLKFLEKISKDLQIYENTRAVKVEGEHVYTDDQTVKAQQIVFASHYPFLNKPGYYFMRMHQERSYVLSLRGAMELHGLYLGTDEENQWSLRQQGDYLLFGGAGHRTGENSEGGRYNKLREMAKALWPDCEVESYWSAQDCMTMDGIPYIGQYSSDTPNWYVATGFGKWGMTHSMVAAERITDLILGMDCEDSQVFSPQRFNLSGSASTMLEDGLKSVKGLGKGYLLPEEEPRCPHLGCRLEKNLDEDSWECPCHGSRFDKHGNLTDGPAQEGLSETAEGDQKNE